MKTLKEALITKNTRDWASAKINWPNPYNLSEKDQIEHLKNVPLEIITLALKEIQLQYGESGALKDLQRFGIASSFSWDNTKDGYIFWRKICDKDYQIFYDTYTPEKLKQRLKE